VVDLVEARLWTPIGLRSLAPGERGYAPRYEWGPLRATGCTARSAQQDARARFLAPLLAHLDDAGLGHVSEIADASLEAAR
jgi:glycogen debranching enzyme